MQSSVTIAFGPGREFEVRLPAAGDAITPRAAREWLGEQWDELGCVPTSPVGKVLLLDTILHVALAAGEKRFAEGGAWVEAFARNVSAALDRPVVRVDVADNRVG